MHISARTDYAVRAMLVIADAHPRLVKAAEIATVDRIPASFLTEILMDLRRNGLVLSFRGVEGGHGLARSADEISVGDILRATDGVLVTTVRGRPTVLASYDGPAQGLREVWLSLDRAITEIVDRTTLSDLLATPARSQAD
ncbi:RrF2 family transcriptional regulator [Plantactinospora sonchi]|uniref:Rrf2 family transcriptional regulator n=1 Tax=Plantactinospora sonchi TaxID=1544735 RepID=A0ABU7RW95_9ACTN